MVKRKAERKNRTSRYEIKKIIYERLASYPIKTKKLQKIPEENIKRQPTGKGWVTIDWIERKPCPYGSPKAKRYSFLNNDPLIEKAELLYSAKKGKSFRLITIPLYRLSKTKRAEKILSKYFDLDTWFSSSYFNDLIRERKPQDTESFESSILMLQTFLWRLEGSKTPLKNEEAYTKLLEEHRRKTDKKLGNTEEEKILEYYSNILIALDGMKHIIMQQEDFKAREKGILLRTQSKKRNLTQDKDGLCGSYSSESNSHNLSYLQLGGYTNSLKVETRTGDTT